MVCGNTILKLAERVNLRSLPTNKKTPRTPKRTTPRRRAGTKKTRTVSRVKRTTRAAKPRVRSRPVHHKITEETTYVYECTRPRCEYRNWREGKEAAGHLRLVLP